MSETVDHLLSIMDRLRDPGGCPWDRKQDLESLSGYLLEEAYEVIEAVHSGDLSRLREELGDLLLQIVFMAKIGAENSAFNFEEVAGGISEKLIRRHPHVFGENSLQTAEEVSRQWEDIKTEERAESKETTSALDGVPTALPALLKAYRMTQKAAGLGFDWDKTSDVVAKLREEVEELEEAIREEQGRSRIRSEMGDILFTLANLSRHLEIEPETALQGSNDSFRRRFQLMEQLSRELGVRLSEMSLQDLDHLWEQAKTISSDN